MRLLQADGSGKFHLIEHANRNTPPYAILSHIRGADGDKVTYKDMVGGEGKSKAGYCKLSVCAKQAANDDLGLSCVDTVPAVSTRQAVQNSQKQSTPCSVGTIMLPNATSICPTFLSTAPKERANYPEQKGYQASSEVDGLHEAGHYKSS
jgi:hypothetical protein